MNHPCGSCGLHCNRNQNTGAFGSGSFGSGAGIPAWTPLAAKTTGNCVMMRPKTTGNCASPRLAGPRGPLKRNNLTLGSRLPNRHQIKTGRPLTAINENSTANAQLFLQSIDELSQPQRGDNAAQCENPGHHHHHQHHPDGTCCVGPQHVGCSHESSGHKIGQSCLHLNTQSSDHQYIGNSKINLVHSPSKCNAGHRSGSQAAISGCGQQGVGLQQGRPNACSFCTENHYTGVCGQASNHHFGASAEQGQSHIGGFGGSADQSIGSLVRQPGQHQIHGIGSQCPFHGLVGHNNHQCTHMSHLPAQSPLGPGCGQDTGCRICVEPPKLFPGCNGRPNLGSAALNYDKMEIKPKMKKIDVRHPGRHFEKHGHDLRIYRNGEHMNLTYQGHVPGEMYVYGKSLPCATTFAKKRLETNIPYEVLDINGCCYCP